MSQPPPHRPLRRATAHLVTLTPDGQAHVANQAGAPALPGARLRFGDDPTEVARAAAGLPPGTPLTPHDVRTDMVTVHDTHGPAWMHIDRVFYAHLPPTGAGAGHTLSVERAMALPAWPAPQCLLDEEPARSGPWLRRFGSYGIVTDPAGRILLSRIAAGFPAAGSWHLPGGGVDHGESSRDALLRELFEETGQHGGIGDLVAIAHHHHSGQPGPAGDSTEIYAVWVFFHAHVAHPRPLRVTEAAGSTVDCAWFTPEDLPHIRLSTTARRGLTAVTASSGG